MTNTLKFKVPEDTCNPEQEEPPSFVKCIEAIMLASYERWLEEGNVPILKK